MKNRKLTSDFYTALAWAIFTLGAGQLALVLGGLTGLVVVLICCASLFVFFLYKAQAPGKRSRQGMAKPYLFSTAILVAGNTLYFYLVFLKPNLSHLVFFTVYILFFIIPLLITIPFLRKSSDVAK